VGIIFNCITFYLITLPLSTLVGNYLNVDPIYFIIPAAYRTNLYVTLMRYPFNMFTVIDLAYNVISFHVVLMTLVLHTKSILTKSATNCHLKDCRDIRSFVMLNLAYKLVSPTVQMMIICTILPLAFVIITSSYVMIRLRGKLHMGLYFMYFVIDALFASLLGVQQPQMADCYQCSKDFIAVLKGNCISRKTWRSNRVRTCKPFGFRMGDMYIIYNGSNNTYFESVVYYTINALISL
jgi:hypothetical protein